MRGSDPAVLILGIGNLLWADEGFGVRAVEALHHTYTFRDNVTLMDGGTQGLYLIQHVQQAEALLIFDAIDYGLAPGTLKFIEGADVPCFMGAKKMSLHQTGFQEVLLTAALLGSSPRHLALVGVQPDTLDDFGGSLTPMVKAQIAPAIHAGLGWLGRIGITPHKRRTPLPENACLSPDSLALDRYESGRPDENTAPRHGDPRVLRDPEVRFDPKPSPLGEHVLSVDIDSRRPR